MSAATYATSTMPKFKVEGQYAVEIRDGAWAKLYSIVAEIEAGSRAMPNNCADIEREMPIWIWPDV